jgi:hypothetical protein
MNQLHMNEPTRIQMKFRTLTLHLLCPLLLVMVTQGRATAQEESNPLTGFVGTFSRTGVSTDGIGIAIKRVIEATDKPGIFLQTRTITPADGSDVSQLKIEMQIEPLSSRVLKYRIVRYKKVLPKAEASDWISKEKTQDMVGVLQVRGNFHYSTNNLTEPAQIWIRQTDDYATLDADSLSVLEPLTKTYVGRYDSAGSAAYNASASSTLVKCTGRTNATGTVLSFDWTMHAEGAPSERAFEAHAICMFDSSTGRITSHIYNSVGVAMKADLVRARGGKLLWERTAQAPAGEIRELCLFDFSEPGVFRHRIVLRTLNGAVIDQEEEDIVLRLEESDTEAVEK